MSVSMRSTKTQMYTEIERLRMENDRLRAQTRQSVAAPTPPRTRTRAELSAFCAAYCRKHGVNSVPGHVVKGWMTSQ